MNDDECRERCGKDKRHTAHWHKNFSVWCDGKPVVKKS